MLLRNQKVVAMEDEGTLESIESAEGHLNVRGELPGWYVRYLAYLYEREGTGFISQGNWMAGEQNI
jgi:hypothetical protein